MSRRKPDWHPEDIKAAVRKTGTTLTELALKNDLSESACRNSLRKKTPRADQLIARQIGKPLQEIWPSRYGSKAGAAPKTRHERDQDTHVSDDAHRLSSRGG